MKTDHAFLTTNPILVFPDIRLDRRLTPNGRTHWAVKHRLLAAHKSAAFYNLKALLAGQSPEDLLENTPRPITVVFTRFYSGAGKPFDDDNQTSAWKGYRDGLALALGIDDNPEAMKGVYVQTRCTHNEDRLTIEIKL